MQSRFKSWVAGWAAAWVLAACGGGGGGGASPAPAPAPAPTPTPPVVSPARVSLAASTPAGPVASNSGTQIQVTVTNDGAATATGVSLSPNLAPSLSYSGFTCASAGGGACPASSNGATIALPDLPAKASVTLVLSITLTPGTTGPLTSMPAVQAANDDVTTDNTAAVVVQAYTADVRVTGSGPTAPVAAGSTVPYVMTVSNIGPDEARDVVITNTLGDFQTLGVLGCKASGGATCPEVLSYSMVVPRLPKGASLEFTVPATVLGGVSGSIANVMTARTLGDPVDTNNAAAVQLSAYVPTPVVQPGQSVITLQSDGGDFIGAGRSYFYTRANANLTVRAVDNRLLVQVTGDDYWYGNFQLPDGTPQVQPGSFSGLKRYPFHNPTAGGLDWTGNGRGCNELTGSFTITSATYVAGALSAVEMNFEQHCEGAGPALRGQIKWYASDTTTPPGPVNPPPANLWAPAAGSTPASGNYVYLQSDTGDFIGNGRRYTYTQADAVLTVNVAGGGVSVNVSGDQGWSGSFQAMQGLAQLQPGYYGNLQRSGFANPTRGGLDWGGEARGCNTLTGWFVVDRVSWVNGALAALDLRFEQHCEGATPALRGKVHWEAGDRTAPAGPVSPPPADLWAPAAGSTPASGNYVHLVSDVGDFIGGGRTQTYTQSNAVLGVQLSGAKLTVAVSGDQGWGGTFLAMNTVADLQPGYYGSLMRYPFGNPTRGSMEWSGDGRGCNRLTGWFVVDSLTRVNGQLTALDLRFEQHCEGMGPALRGKVHWEAGDRTVPPGPVNPPPATLWAPAAGSTPASGAYVYLTSDAGDYIGQGRTSTYTRSNAVLGVRLSGTQLTVSVNGDQSWTGDFAGMNSIATLQPGYYGNLQRYPFVNPTRGGLNWGGEGRNCNMLTGWFAIDSLTLVNGQVAALDLRFEQHCEGATPALRGKVHWVP
ncbi:hypothetical protein [Roseateles sp. BYS87W]|uniref:DUF11 domain-containing protein n=1 Tax=Pelomonas baiyunensis TaxID=3299026 RepID=A0ABW7H0S0_9BURK